jgi:uncharacterized RDD family membrane protein YckC
MTDRITLPKTPTEAQRMHNEQNPYNAPEANVSYEPPGASLQPADRLMRLVAAIIDGLIMLAILLPLMFVGGYFAGIMEGAQPGFGKQLMWGGISFIVFVLVQAMPLNATGQTWGKKALKMKIVDMQGNKPPLGHIILMRYLPTQAISAIPCVGVLYALTDVLFIFANDRRCLHDKIAGTQVVVAD